MNTVPEKTECWNCRVPLAVGEYALMNPVDGRYMCQDCADECEAWNDYINSVSQDDEPV